MKGRVNEMRRNAVLFVGFFTVAFVLTVTLARAAEVTPAKQQQLNQLGWTIQDDETSEPDSVTKNGECRGKHIGTAIKNWRGDTMVTGRVKLRACARGGRITWATSNYAHASPSHWWDHVWGPTIDRWHWGIKTAEEWKCQTTAIDQYWRLDLKLVAHVSGDHQIWFTKVRNWG